MYRPDYIYVDQAVKDEFFTRNILQKFPTTPTMLVDSSDKKLFQPTNNLNLLTSGKKILYLKKFLGEAIRLCPGFTEKAICCNYYVLDFIENCPLDCTYCILQAYLNKPIITLHVNVEEMLNSIERFILAQPHRHFRIGTGEHSDSLALDDIFELNAMLVAFFAKLPNATLELKTKTDDVAHLSGLQHNGRTVIAWSLNPQEIVRREELKTASLESRLKAASRMAAEGYGIAFHFDPIIHYPGWEKGYGETIEAMFDAVTPEKIAWISMGTLRYIPELKKIAEARFPRLSIFCNEFISAEDGKMRYFKPLRVEMLSIISHKILKTAPKIPLYLCMEKSSVWGKTMPYTPLDHDDLEGRLTKG